MAADPDATAPSLRLARDDLSLMGLPAFVYYARHDLALGSGFGAAISARGGQGIQKELDELGPAETGDVVVSGAGELKSEWILHAVGPRFQEEDMEGKLRKTMQNVFAVAMEKGIRVLGFPPMGAGYYGVPLDQCAKVMVEEIRSHLGGEATLREVVIAVGDGREERAFQPLMAGA